MSGCVDLFILHCGCAGSCDVSFERDAQRGQVQVAIDAAELFAGLDHAGRALPQCHLPVPPARDVLKCSRQIEIIDSIEFVERSVRASAESAL